jgi:ketosteroid isomerase-like protein
MRRNVILPRPVQARHRRRRTAIVVTAFSALAFAGTATLSVHDSWIVPNAFAIDADGSREVRGRPLANARVAGTIGAAQAPNDSAAVAATVERFHTAVVAGDSARALSLLTADAVVLESGGMETREEFRSHHLPADIAFAQAVKSERGPMRVVVRGDAAWTTSTSTATGEYRGRQVNSSGAELMVLTRTPQGWRIAAIHWSSRTRRPAAGQAAR